jgi:ELWxxDGT repeat protein
MVVLINKLYIFLRTDSFEIEIWSYDGLNQPDFVCNFTEERDPSDLIVFNDKMFFYTTIPWPNDDGVIKLYIFDGFSSPMVFADVALNGFENPSALNYFTTYKRATVFNNSLIFVGNDDIHGDELWIYDGLNKPKLLADINPGQGNSHPCYFHEFDHKLYFSADDGIHGAELWVYEPDSIVDIIPDSIVNVNPEKLVKLNIYPNPAKQLINIQFANQNVKNQILVICDLSGKQILIQTIHSANQAIDISSLVRGYYIISIYSNTGTLIGSQPLIKY